MSDQNENTCNDKSPWARSEEEIQIAESSLQEVRLSVWFPDDEEFVAFSDGIGAMGIPGKNLDVKFDTNIPDGYVRINHPGLETFDEFPVQVLLDMLMILQTRKKFLN